MGHTLQNDIGKGWWSARIAINPDKFDKLIITALRTAVDITMEH
ncbi:MAG: hypothetical protein ACJ72C_09965 [Nitrososphaeraceae archaeon]